MGWIYEHATHYIVDRKGNRKVDRKKQCDEELAWENDNAKCEVLKSAMRGSVYYAAARITYKGTNSSKVLAAVVLTRLDRGSYCNFGYKAMEETVEPFYYDCPKSILDLLSPTDNLHAVSWREKCRQISNRRKALEALPVGTVIEWESGDIVYKAKKMAPAYQFKRPWFEDSAGAGFHRKSDIAASNWRAVSQ